MINSKNNITPDERKRRVAGLRQAHQNYFDTVGKSDALFIPKMAYRPPGKDGLYISFFPSELKNESDIYTEFVSIEYLAEDPKRTLYLVRHNPFWREEYEMITSNSGYERHLVPVNELKIINNISDRELLDSITEDNTSDINKNPSNTLDKNFNDLIQVLEDINYTLQSINRKINR